LPPLLPNLPVAPASSESSSETTESTEDDDDDYDFTKNESPPDLVHFSELAGAMDEWTSFDDAASFLNDALPNEEHSGSAASHWIGKFSSAIRRALGREDPHETSEASDEQGSLNLHDGYKGCCKCVRRATAGILLHMDRRARKHCNATQDKCQKEWCAAARKHHRVVVGIAIGKYHPHTMAYAYCSGKGFCHRKNFTDEVGECDWSADSQQNVHLEEVSSLIRQASSSEQESDGEASISSDDQWYDDWKQRQGISQVVVGRMPWHGCKRCVHAGSMHVVGKAMVRAHKLCKETKCPHLKKVCKWAKKHKPEFLGMVLAHHTPHRYAIGYCAARHVCQEDNLPCLGLL